jgi:hypothetical protein
MAIKKNTKSKNRSGVLRFNEILEILKNLLAQIKILAIQTCHVTGADRLQFQDIAFRVN